jgi:hypothetical protein
MLTLTPAYGRDYKSKKALVADFEADRDFIIADFGHPYEGKPVNRSQLVETGERQAKIRYAQLRKVAVLEVRS